MLADSGAVLVFAETDAHAERIEQLKGELPDLRKVLRIDGSGPSALDALAEAGKALDPASLDERLAGIRAADPATLIYTSGTTGRPKGCQLTHSNLVVRDPRRQGILPDAAWPRASACWSSCRWPMCWPARSRSRHSPTR